MIEGERQAPAEPERPVARARVVGERQLRPEPGAARARRRSARVSEPVPVTGFGAELLADAADRAAALRQRDLRGLHRRTCYVSLFLPGHPLPFDGAASRRRATPPRPQRATRPVRIPGALRSARVDARRHTSRRRLRHHVRERSACLMETVRMDEKPVVVPRARPTFSVRRARRRSAGQDAPSTRTTAPVTRRFAGRRSPWRSPRLT